MYIAINSLLMIAICAINSLLMTTIPVTFVYVMMSEKAIFPVIVNSMFLFLYSIDLGIHTLDTTFIVVKLMVFKAMLGVSSVNCFLTRSWD